MNRYLLTALTFFVLFGLAYAQSTTVTVLFPPTSTSDFSTNSALYQLWHYDPATLGWTQLAPTVVNGSNASGLTQPVSSFKGQFAVVKTAGVPTADSCSAFSPTALKISGPSVTNATLNLADHAPGGGVVSSQSINVKIYDDTIPTPELVTQSTVSLACPRIYTLSINFASINPASSSYMIVVSANGQILLNTFWVTWIH